MPINVSDAISTDTAEIITIERTSNGGYVDGIYQPGLKSNFKTLCSVQQPTPQQMQFLPEGDRDKDTKLFISKRSLRTGDDKDNVLPDVALHRGKRYKIVATGDWISYGFTSSLGVRE